MEKIEERRNDALTIVPRFSKEAMFRWNLWKKLNAYEKSRYYYKADLEPSLEQSISKTEYEELAPEEM